MNYKAEDFQEGTECVFTNKNHGIIKSVQLVYLINVYGYGEFKSTNLKDKKTGDVIKKNGECRTWIIKNAFEQGIIVPLKYQVSKANRLCPCCNSRYIENDGDSICLQCQREQKEARLKPIREFYSKHVQMNGEPFVLDDEQLECIESNDNTLVTARAGSGKTRVLVAKLIDLLHNKKLGDDEVLAFCFNKKVAEEIRQRFNEQCTIDEFYEFATSDIISTFHAYARRIVNPQKEILVDGENCRARTQFIKDIINHLRETKPIFNGQVIKYFLNYTRRVDRRNFRSDKDYYKFVRNSRYRTLNDEYVKSIDEKYIADFLFEHEIPYEYERHFYLNGVKLKESNLPVDEKISYMCMVGDKKETVPDFYLYTYNYVWEHWGVTGAESDAEKREFTKSVCNYDKYLQNRKFKKMFWNKWKDELEFDRSKRNIYRRITQLLETSCTEYKNLSRKDIELKIKNMLIDKGVKCDKLPEEVIITKVWNKAINNFVLLMTQFIDKYQQVYFDDENAFILAAKKIDDEYDKSFLRLGYMVYEEYIHVLNGTNTDPYYKNYKKYGLDFNQCIDKAIKIIKSGECDAEIGRLKWILIDEYQDFSRLFFDLINAMISRNKDIKLFCVGDDWQAINRFAGSDTIYYSNFDKYYSNAKRYNIHTNYRSRKSIVNYANTFMDYCKIEGERPVGKIEADGVIESICLDSVRTDKLRYVSNALFDNDGYWADISYETKNNVLKYLDIIIQIIVENPNKSIAVLHRKGQFLSKKLNEIESIIKKIMKSKLDNFSINTVHSFKGKEADIVIIVEVDNNIFPIFHPDNDLFSIFGEDSEDIIEDEEKLFYVALTRAKKSLYLISSDPSYFVTRE